VTHTVDDSFWISYKYGRPTNSFHSTQHCCSTLSIFVTNMVNK